MTSPIPSVHDVRALLARLSGAQLHELEKQSGVSVHTMTKIKRGETSNPGIETVRVFYPHLTRLAALRGTGSTDVARAAVEVPR